MVFLGFRRENNNLRVLAALDARTNNHPYLVTAWHLTHGTALAEDYEASRILGAGLLSRPWIELDKEREYDQP